MTLIEEIRKNSGLSDENSSEKLEEIYSIWKKVVGHILKNKKKYRERDVFTHRGPYKFTWEEVEEWLDEMSQSFNQIEPENAMYILNNYSSIIKGLKNRNRKKQLRAIAMLATGISEAFDEWRVSWESLLRDVITKSEPFKI